MDQGFARYGFCYGRRYGRPAAKTRIDTEALLEWTYRRQKAHIVVGRGAGLYAVEAGADGIGVYDGPAGIAGFAELGCQIDRCAPDAGALHEDAEAVHEAVMALPRGLRGLVIACASTGTRPPWGEGRRPHYQPQWTHGPNYDGEGRPRKGSYVTIWLGDRQTRRPVLCPIQLADPPEHLVVLRRAYIEWHAAVEAVYRALRGRDLKSHEPLPPAAPAAPWERA